MEILGVLGISGFCTAINIKTYLKLYSAKIIQLVQHELIINYNILTKMVT